MYIKELILDRSSPMLARKMYLGIKNE